MHKLFVVCAALGFAACKGKPNEGATAESAAAKQAAVPGSAGSGSAGSGSAGSGSAGSGSTGGSGNADAAEAPATPPLTEATGPGWKVRAGFGDSPSVFDVTAAALDTLTIEVVDDSGASLFRRTGFAAIAPGAKPPSECEELNVVAAAETWGEARGARISLECVNGEDYKTATETAILIEIRSAKRDAISILWVGDGDEDKDEMDTCLTSHHVKFSVKARTLTQHITDTVERHRGAPRACKAKKTRSTTTDTIQRAG